MRRLIAFPCEGETLLGTLDEAEARTGLLIVSGGNEIRAGAHRGMAMLAAQVAAAGYPVLRFDRRGIGDSTGENHGFRSSAPDITAAVRAFRADAVVTRVIGFGNCDGASALALFGRAAGVDGFILANPWLTEPADDLPPPAAIRARYAQKLGDPAAWRRLLSSARSLRQLARGLLRAARPTLATAPDVLDAIVAQRERAAVIVAERDATALAFLHAARTRPAPDLIRLDTASHSFADAADALAQALIARLRAAG